MPPQRSKRKRVSETELPIQTVPPDKHEIFTKWAQDRGVIVNGVAATQLPGRGMGLLITRRIKAGERLLSIPEKAIFKPNQQLLKDEGILDISPQAQLAISAMVEFNSPNLQFHSWSHTLPTETDFAEGMPMLYDVELRQHLPPPVLQPLERQEADYQRDKLSLNAFLKNQGKVSEFRYWWLIVNSRSFHWKPPRGKKGVMVLCPFVDYVNHAPTGQSCDVKMTNEGYEVVANKVLAPGEEVLATYGPHSNDKLLVHYGFIIEPKTDAADSNVDDDVRLDHVILPKLTAEVRSRLQDVGFLGGYALLPATNELCFKTQVAIRASFLTANEWEYFMQNGEDLGDDQSSAVHRILKRMCGRYMKQCERAILALQEMDQTPSNRLVLLRWAQIGLAISAHFHRDEDAEGEEDQKEVAEFKKSCRRVTIGDTN